MIGGSTGLLILDKGCCKIVNFIKSNIPVNNMIRYDDRYNICTSELSMNIFDVKFELFISFTNLSKDFDFKINDTCICEKTMDKFSLALATNKGVKILMIKLQTSLIVEFTV